MTEELADKLEQIVIPGGSSWLKRQGLTARAPKMERMVCRFLPIKNPIGINHILRFDGISTDWLVAIIEARGLVLPGQDWRNILRKTLAKRIKANRAELFPAPFDTVADTIVEYQLEGGKLSLRESLKDRARKVIFHQHSTSYQAAAARFVMSLCHENENKALTQSFHWLKMVLTMKEELAGLAVQVYKKEDAAMKAALIHTILTTEA